MNAGVKSVAFSPDLTQLVAGSNDGVVTVFNLQNNQAVLTPRPCSSPITAVGFTPDGLTIFAAVAAKNDIQLDTNPSSGNDLNLTLADRTGAAQRADAGRRRPVLPVGRD